MFHSVNIQDLQEQANRIEAILSLLSQEVETAKRIHNEISEIGTENIAIAHEAMSSGAARDEIMTRYQEVHDAIEAAASLQGSIVANFGGPAGPSSSVRTSLEEIANLS